MAPCQHGVMATLCRHGVMATWHHVNTESSQQLVAWQHGNMAT